MALMSGTEILRARRPSDIGNDAHGDSQPMFDPISLLAGLLGPALMRAAAPRMAAGAGKFMTMANKVAPQGSWSHKPLLAELKAELARRESMEATKNLPKYAQTMQPTALPAKPPMAMDSAAVQPRYVTEGPGAISRAPKIDDPMSWDIWRGEMNPMKTQEHFDSNQVMTHLIEYLKNAGKTEGTSFALADNLMQGMFKPGTATNAAIIKRILGAKKN